jgi:hypothetical protein
MNLHDELTARYDALFGTSASWSDDRDGIRVQRYRPRKNVMLEPTSDVFVTAGMSARSMNVPRVDVPSRTELLVVAPPEWTKVYETGDDEFFVVDTLRTTARYPFERNTFLGANHTVPAGRPLAPQTPMCGWVLTTPLILERPAPIATSHGDVTLLLMTPLHAAELAFAQSSGTAALMNRIFSLLETLGVDWSFLLAPKRPDVVAGTTIIV